MPYQPTYPFPYNKGIDGNSIMGNVFRCKVDDYDKISAATLFIYENTANKEVCRIERKRVNNVEKKIITINEVSTEIDLDIAEDSTFPIIGGKGDDSFLQIVVPKTAPNSSVNILNNGYNYKWKIRLYGEKDNVWIAEGYFVAKVTFPNTVYISDNSRILRGQNINIGENKYKIADIKGVNLNGRVSAHLVESQEVTCEAPTEGGTLEEWVKNFENVNDYTELYLVLAGVDSFKVTAISGNKVTIDSKPTVSYLEKRYNLVRYCNIAKTENGSGTIPIDTYYHITSDFIESMQYYFTAETEYIPTIYYLDDNKTEIEPPYNITSSVGEFTASYEGELLYYKWTLQKRDEDSYQEINTTGEVFSSYIYYKYEGFMVGDNYRLILEVVTREKTKTTVSISFGVDYDELMMPVEPLLSIDCERKAVKVDFYNLIEIKGNSLVPNAYTLKEEATYNTCSINSGNHIRWDKITGRSYLEIKPTYCSIIRFKTNSANFSGKIFEMASASGATYSCRISGTTIYNKVTTNTEDSFNVGESFNNNWWNLYVYDEGIVLYKEGNSTPICNLRDINQYNLKNEYSELTIHGGITYMFVQTYNRLFTEAEVLAINASGSHIPIWDGNTYLLASFSNTINASPIYIEKGGLDGVIVYRENLTDGKTIKIAKLNNGVNFFYDYAVNKLSLYRYIITPIYKKTVSSVDKYYLGNSVITDSIIPRWNTFSIIGTLNNYNQEEEYIYEVDNDNVWHLDLNAGNNSVNVVTDKTVYDGLYAYAKVNSTNKNYKVGNAKALIGRMNGITYEDSIKLANKWQQFCNNGRVKLLRDQQGNLIPVDITAKSFEYTNDTIPTTITINFEWTQVGSDEEISVYETTINKTEEIGTYKKLVTQEGQYIQDENGVFLTSKDISEYN